MVALVDLDEEVRGDTIIYDLTLSREGALAGWMNGGTVRFMAKLRTGDADADAIFTKASPASGITWVDQAAVNPTATVLIEPEDYDGLVPGKAKTLAYEIEITDAGGRVETIQKGSLPILADVLRGS